MSLFLANTTRQHHKLMWTRNGAHRARDVPFASQVQIDDEVDAQLIIAQHRAYGLVAASELPRGKSFVGLCYSLGEPVALDAAQFADSVKSSDFRNFTVASV